LVLLLTGCHQVAPNKTVSPTPSPTKATVFGEWVCIADNGGGFKGSKMTLKEDGTAEITEKGKTRTVKYRRESGAGWFQRRNLQLGQTLGTASSTKQNLGPKQRSSLFERPGVEVVYFVEPDGRFADYGGNLLLYVPEVPLLFNILTQAWSRPGDEKRVTAIMSGR